jgi:Tfp pilus assembly protein PilN
MTTVLDINLIAGRRRQKQRAITILRCAVYSLIVLFLAVALLYARLTAATKLTQGRIAEVEAKLSDPTLAEAVSRIQFLDGNIGKLEPRVDLLEKVHDSEQAWIQILRDVGACVPTAGNVWLSQLGSHRAEKEQVLSLRGSAFNQSDIGEFMLNLDKPAWSKAPALGFTQMNVTQQGRSVIQFEITVPLSQIIGSGLK